MARFTRQQAATILDIQLKANSRLLSEADQNWMLELISSIYMPPIIHAEDDIEKSAEYQARVVQIISPLIEHYQSQQKEALQLCIQALNLLWEQHFVKKANYPENFATIQELLLNILMQEEVWSNFKDKKINSQQLMSSVLQAWNDAVVIKQGRVIGINKKQLAEKLQQQLFSSASSHSAKNKRKAATAIITSTSGDLEGLPLKKEYNFKEVVYFSDSEKYEIVSKVLLPTGTIPAKNKFYVEIKTETKDTEEGPVTSRILHYVVKTPKGEVKEGQIGREQLVEDSAFLKHIEANNGDIKALSPFIPILLKIASGQAETPLYFPPLTKIRAGLNDLNGPRSIALPTTTHGAIDVSSGLEELGKTINGLQQAVDKCEKNKRNWLIRVFSRLEGAPSWKDNQRQTKEYIQRFSRGFSAQPQTKRMNDLQRFIGRKLQEVDTWANNQPLRKALTTHQKILQQQSRTLFITVLQEKNLAKSSQLLNSLWDLKKLSDQGITRVLGRESASDPQLFLAIQEFLKNPMDPADPRLKVVKKILDLWYSNRNDLHLQVSVNQNLLVPLRNANFDKIIDTFRMLQAINTKAPQGENTLYQACQGTLNFLTDVSYSRHYPDDANLLLLLAGLEVLQNHSSEKLSHLRQQYFVAAYKKLLEMLKKCPSLTEMQALFHSETVKKLFYYLEHQADWKEDEKTALQELSEQIDREVQQKVENYFYALTADINSDDPQKKRYALQLFEEFVEGDFCLYYPSADFRRASSITQINQVLSRDNINLLSGKNYLQVAETYVEKIPDHDNKIRVLLNHAVPHTVIGQRNDEFIQKAKTKVHQQIKNILADLINPQTERRKLEAANESLKLMMQGDSLFAKEQETFDPKHEIQAELVEMIKAHHEKSDAVKFFISLRKQPWLVRHFSGSAPVFLTAFFPTAKQGLLLPWLEELVLLGNCNHNASLAQEFARCFSEEFINKLMQEFTRVTPPEAEGEGEVPEENELKSLLQSQLSGAPPSVIAQGSAFLAQVSFYQEKYQKIEKNVSAMRDGKIKDKFEKIDESVKKDEATSDNNLTKMLGYRQQVSSHYSHLLKIYHILRRTQNISKEDLNSALRGLQAGLSLLVKNYRTQSFYQQEISWIFEQLEGILKNIGTSFLLAREERCGLVAEIEDFLLRVQAFDDLVKEKANNIKHICLVLRQPENQVGVIHQALQDFDKANGDVDYRTAQILLSIETELSLHYGLPNMAAYGEFCLENAQARSNSVPQPRRPGSGESPLFTSLRNTSIAEATPFKPAARVSLQRETIEINLSRYWDQKSSLLRRNISSTVAGMGARLKSFVEEKLKAVAQYQSFDVKAKLAEAAASTEEDFFKQPGAVVLTLLSGDVQKMKALHFFVKKAAEKEGKNNQWQALRDHHYVKSIAQAILGGQETGLTDFCKEIKDVAPDYVARLQAYVLEELISQPEMQEEKYKQNCNDYFAKIFDAPYVMRAALENCGAYLDEARKCHLQQYLKQVRLSTDEPEDSVEVKVFHSPHKSITPNKNSSVLRSPVRRQLELDGEFPVAVANDLKSQEQAHVTGVARTVISPVAQNSSSGKRHSFGVLVEKDPDCSSSPKKPEENKKGFFNKVKSLVTG